MKGITYILQTAKLVLQKQPDWQWKIIGEGEMQETVSAFIEKENLQNKLILQKPVGHNIYPEYQNASMFVLASRNESFSMVLLEAMSNGLPCIAFDCDTGPRHIIKHNEDGILVEKENPDKLAEAIDSLISNEEKRKKMGVSAIANVQRFYPESIYQLWKKEVIDLK
jgi:glycosyltransferase involved in cell wall biosynthesis